MWLSCAAGCCVPMGGADVAVVCRCGCRVPMWFCACLRRPVHRWRPCSPSPIMTAAYRHVHRHACRHAYRHVHGHACRHAFGMVRRHRFESSRAHSVILEYPHVNARAIRMPKSSASAERTGGDRALLPQVRPPRDHRRVPDHPFFAAEVSGVCRRREPRRCADLMAPDDTSLGDPPPPLLDGAVPS